MNRTNSIEKLIEIDIQKNSHTFGEPIILSKEERILKQLPDFYESKNLEPKYYRLNSNSKFYDEPKPEPLIEPRILFSNSTNKLLNFQLPSQSDLLYDSLGHRKSYLFLNQTSLEKKDANEGEINTIIQQPTFVRDFPPFEHIKQEIHQSISKLQKINQRCKTFKSLQHVSPYSPPMDPEAIARFSPPIKKKSPKKHDHDHTNKELNEVSMHEHLFGTSSSVSFPSSNSSTSIGNKALDELETKQKMISETKEELSLIQEEEQYDNEQFDNEYEQQEEHYEEKNLQDDEVEEDEDSDGEDPIWRQDLPLKPGLDGVPVLQSPEVLDPLLLEKAYTLRTFGSKSNRNMRSDSKYDISGNQLVSIGHIEEVIYKSKRRFGLLFDRKRQQRSKYLEKLNVTQKRPSMILNQFNTTLDSPNKLTDSTTKLSINIQGLPPIDIQLPFDPQEAPVIQTFSPFANKKRVSIVDDTPSFEMKSPKKSSEKPFSERIIKPVMVTKLEETVDEDKEEEDEEVVEEGTVGTIGTEGDGSVEYLYVEDSATSSQEKKTNGEDSIQTPQKLEEEEQQSSDSLKETSKETKKSTPKKPRSISMLTTSLGYSSTTQDRPRSASNQIKLHPLSPEKHSIMENIKQKRNSVVAGNTFPMNPLEATTEVLDGIHPYLMDLIHVTDHKTYKQNLQRSPKKSMRRVSVGFQLDQEGNIEEVHYESQLPQIRPNSAEQRPKDRPSIFSNTSNKGFSPSISSRGSTFFRQSMVSNSNNNSNNNSNPSSQPMTPTTRTNSMRPLVSPQRSKLKNTIYAMNKKDLQHLLMISPSDEKKEREALITIYELCGGTSWVNQTNWCSDKPYRDWYGVGCNVEGYVYELHLPNNNLFGSFPDNFHQFTKLEVIDLDNNRLYSSLPEYSLGQCVNLRILSVRHNELQGYIPFKHMHECQKLQQLWCSHNNFNGTIFEEKDGIFLLTKLTHVCFYQNELYGKIHPNIVNLAELVYLSLGKNELSGEIPESIIGLSKLQTLSLHSNHLEGKTPFWLQAMYSLEDLDYFDNRFVD